MSQVSEMSSATELIDTTAPAKAAWVVEPKAELIVAIDGPAGSGKSSVARLLAQRIGLDFLDTGAMYRAAATVMIDHGLTFDDRDSLVRKIEQANIGFDWTSDPPDILAFGRSVAHRIRQDDVTALVSPLAAIAEVRTLMVALQKQIGEAHPRLVTEGRDQGSVVFPTAAFKIYLTATAEKRAERRVKQLRAEDRHADEAQVLKDIIERDERDMSRKDGPLCAAKGGKTLDTSELSREQVIDTLEDIVRGRGRRHQA
jgi:cytidylate kinase